MKDCFHDANFKREGQLSHVDASTNIIYHRALRPQSKKQGGQKPEWIQVFYFHQKILTPDFWFLTP